MLGQDTTSSPATRKTGRGWVRSNKKADSWCAIGFLVYYRVVYLVNFVPCPLITFIKVPLLISYS